MVKGIAAKYTCTFFLILFTAFDLSSQDEQSEGFTIMFYNVENLFDINDDPGEGDNEFLPGSLRRWNYSRYKRKLDALAKTIIAAGNWEPPALIAMCEIENRKVLKDLVSGTVISKYNYSIIHQDSHDPRGIDIGFIYRSERISVTDYRYIPVEDENRNRIATRDILAANISSGNSELILFVNHWPSRRGGVQATEALREAAAFTLRKQVDSVFTAYGADARILVTGDFNAGPGDGNIHLVAKGDSDELTLINLTEEYKSFAGTYKYQGLWETIDQVFVSGSLIKAENGFVTKKENLRIMANEHLLTDDLDFTGKTPFPTWKGYRYTGGFSDHLPVVIDLLVRRASLPVADQAPCPF